MKILSGNSNLKLAKDIAKRLDMPLLKANLRSFSDDEIFIEILENVRGEDVFVIQPTSSPANHNIMELLIMIDALRRGSAHRITAVIPYYGYARQDRKTGPRTPITSKLVANLIEKAGADRVLTIDLHAGQIQGFFDIPTDNLYAHPTLRRDLMRQLGKDDKFIIVSPDVGGVVRARAFAKKHDADLAIIDKRRPEAGVSEVMNVIGNVKNKHCILVDDMVDSAGTLCNAADALIEKGALSVSAYVTHGVLSNNAVARIEASQLKSVVITDTIASTSEVDKSSKVRQITVAKLLASAIKRINNNKSVSSLFA